MGAGKSFIERCVELYNAHEFESYMGLYAEDAVLTMPDGTFEGRAAIRERRASTLAAFADAAYIVESVVEKDDRFTDEWIFVGTHTGPLVLPDGSVLPPSGKRVEFRGMEFVEVRDGEIVVDNLYYDNLAIAAQLGVVPQGVPATAS
jgi:steroid delta-isomerase-like uncharacterized protein